MLTRTFDSEALLLYLEIADRWQFQLTGYAGYFITLIKHEPPKR